MRPVPFAKLSGSGNDFVVLDGAAAASLGDGLLPWIRAVCRRGISIGADGVLVVTPAGPDRVRVVFRNPDGAEAFCGNGSRCAARYAAHRGFAGSRLVLDTAWGEVPAEIDDRRVRIRLPLPVDEGEVAIPLARPVVGRRIRAGVPHFVVRVDDLAAHAVDREGPELRRHPAFGPEGTNVDWIAPTASGAWAIRTWERGVEGETLACGSGAVAAAWDRTLAGAGEAHVLVPRSGIALTVRFETDASGGRSTVLEGDARLVFEGTASSEAAD